MQPQHLVIPAHAGIHCVNMANHVPNAPLSNEWIPAFAGMTTGGLNLVTNQVSK